MAKEVTPEQIQMLEEMVARAQKAADIIATYDQARVDRLCQAVAAAVCDMKVWAQLSDEAVDETGLGDKVTKRNKIKLILRDCLRQKSVGVIEEIPEKGIVKYAKPVGVIASLVPTTNPCLTPAGQVVYAIKARDVIICSPHPRAKKTTNKCINIIREALVREGAPADIIQGIEEPSISLTQELMKRCQLTIATGGRPMVKSAYSTGVPAYGSGAGNATVIIDDTCDTPDRQAEAAGFTIPEDRKFIAVTGGGIENVGKEHFFSSEKLTTLLTLFKYKGEFQNALDMMQAMFNVGGKGHSCGIYSWDDSHIDRLGMCAPVSRIMVRQPNNRGNSGSAWNGMPPTSSMGCGTWGGNIVSENICLKHYMNTTWVARPLPYDMPSNEELFGEFCKPGMDEE